MKSSARLFVFCALFFASLTALFAVGIFFVPSDKQNLRFSLLFCYVAVFCLALYILTRRTRSLIRKKLSVDSLTGLSTRDKFCEDVSKILKSKEKSGDGYSIVSLDVSKFRYISDVLGKESSEKLLALIARALKKNAPKDALLCRNYKDNFLVFIHATFQPIVEDIVVTMTDLKGEIGSLLPEYYTVDFSLGVYVVVDLQEDVSTMCDKANTAREFGKRGTSPKRISFYDAKMQADTENEKKIIFDMNRAFEDEEFVPFYQPKFRFSDAKVVGAEALVRWQHKDFGLISPDSFVPFFEKNGFIQKIDVAIFESVCRFLDKWNHSGKDGGCPEPITISCNLSRFQLYDPDVAKNYAKIASKYKIAPNKIELELTESLMMDNKARLLRAMNEIKKAGFGISVDDFGSGFSSLSLLKDIPATVIKLDKEFFANSTSSERDNVIVGSVIDMAKKLDLTTVAEGVEYEEQAESLRNMGCDIAQGFLYAKPMSESDFERLLHNSLD